jgi:hypothetical protein
VSVRDAGAVAHDGVCDMSYDEDDESNETATSRKTPHATVLARTTAAPSAALTMADSWLPVFDESLDDTANAARALVAATVSVVDTPSTSSSSSTAAQSSPFASPLSSPRPLESVVAAVPDHVR